MKEDDRASRPEDENPEWVRKEIRNARPALEMIGEVFGATAADRLRRGRGRPRKADKKVSQNLRLDADVLEAFQREGKGVADADQQGAARKHARCAKVIAGIW